MLQRILDYAHHLLNQSVSKGDCVVDGTAGNGHDTLFLSKMVGTNGRVLSFDIQDQAMQKTSDLLVQHQVENVTLIHDSHEHVRSYLPDNFTEFGGAIFNLGYLPGSDKSIITEPQPTISAVQEILARLKKNGIIVMVVYHGHAGGEEEKIALLKYTAKLDQKQYSVLQYGFINQANNPPFILAIEKK